MKQFSDPDQSQRQGKKHIFATSRNLMMKEGCGQVRWIA